MKIISCNGGLGNQMFQIALYYMLKKQFKKNDIFLDLSNYVLNKIHNQFEIKNIFNLDIDTNTLKISKRFLFKIKVKKMIKKTFIIKIYKKIKNQSIDKKYFYELPFEKDFEKKYIKYLEKNYRIKSLDSMRVFFLMGEYVESIFNVHESTYILGCPQSEKYFNDIKCEIKEIFSFPKFKNIKNITIADEINRTNSVAIHIRRGDYLDDPALGGLIKKEYYIAAIEYIRKKITNPKFYIFSNDIEWCKKNLKLENVCFIDWNKGKESYRDMQLMSLCKHNIIPNSTFSWWGAWLNKNPNKIVIAPKVWINPKTGLKDLDIIPNEWIKIDNY